MPFLESLDELGQTITSLSLEIRTADAPEAGTNSKVYCNVVFTDGSLLFNPLNHRIHKHFHNDFEPGITDAYSLPLPTDNFAKTIGDIEQFYIRKEAGEPGGWLLGSALLFANDLGTPIMGNNQINEFLDDEAATLFRRDWSPLSLRGSGELPAKYPLLSPSYRIAGPVLGQLSDSTATILYRVDQEGTYRLRVVDAASGQLVFVDDAPLSPTATFKVTRLLPNRHYRFSFFRVFGGQDIPVPDGDGEFRTYPPEGSGVRFGLAFGSCARNKHDVVQSAWVGIRNLAADPAVDASTAPRNNIRLFLHLGDTTYFHDDVTDTEPANLATFLAAHLSQRRHPRFLDMARRAPCCAVWDDHDFRGDNEDSQNFAAKPQALSGFLDYWGNNPIAPAEFGLTTLITYGNVDIYLMDGRFRRNTGEGQLFTQEQVGHVLSMMAQRGSTTNRLVILASGSTWNHTNTGSDEPYGSRTYENERETFYRRLNELIGDEIKGLVFLSGDIHRNEIHEIALAGSTERVAPEFVSSPLGNNSSLSPAGELEGERKWSIGSEEDDGKKGFAMLEIDTTAAVPEGNWRITVNFYDANSSVSAPYKIQDYVLTDGQFVYIE